MMCGDLLPYLWILVYRFFFVVSGRDSVQGDVAIYFAVDCFPKNSGLRFFR